MEPEDTQLMKRLKTFGWSLGWVTAAAVVDHSLASLGALNLPTVTVIGIDVNTAVVVGLALTQVSKWIRNNASTI